MNSILFIVLSLYNCLVSLSSILRFFLILVNDIVRLILSIYKRNLTAWDGNNSKIYIRKSIDNIGLPYRIPVSISLNSSNYPLNNSLNSLLFKKLETQLIRDSSSPFFFNNSKSLFLTIWLKAPLISKNSVEVILLDSLFSSTILDNNRATSIGDFFNLPPI